MTTNSNETSKADPTHLGHIISSDYYMITLKILRPDQYFGIYIYTAATQTNYLVWHNTQHLECL